MDRKEQDYYYLHHKKTERTRIRFGPIQTGLCSAQVHRQKLERYNLQYAVQINKQIDKHLYLQVNENRFQNNLQ